MNSTAGTQRRQLGPLRFYAWSVVIGVVGALGAVVFRDLIALVHNFFFLGQWSFVYDANVHTAPSPWGPFVILVPVLGVASVAFLVSHFAPEARGHGVPEVVDAIYYNKGVIRPVVAVVKSLASALSIGSGGSIGREGPIIQIGSSFGSSLSEILGVPTCADRRLITVGENTPLLEVITRLRAAQVSVAVVTDGTGELTGASVRGLITKDEIATPVIDGIELFSEEPSNDGNEPRSDGREQIRSISGNTLSAGAAIGKLPVEAHRTQTESPKLEDSSRKSC